jgi:TonB family protein
MPDLLPAAVRSINGQVNVAVRVKVDSRGEVLSAAFDSAGTSRYFSKVALEAAQHWRFKPPQVDGQAVPSVWVLRFHFTQTASEATPVEIAP